jgi:1-acyl-sn-glycerol-3-phosphate acyltransferase
MYSNILHIFQIIFSRLAKFLLLLIGWNFITDKKNEYKNLVANKNYLVVFPHTTYWDAVIFMIYRNAYPDIFRNSKMYLKPDYFDNTSYGVNLFLNKLGFFRANSVNNEKKEHTIKKTTEKLKNLSSNYLLWMSPKGTIMNKPWRSGYYYLAKELNIPIVVAGLDYEKKQCVISDIFHIDFEKDSKDSVEEKIKNSMSKIVPLNIENSEIEIKENYDKENITVINWKNFFIFLFIFITVCVLIWYLKFSFFSIFKILSTLMSFI